MSGEKKLSAFAVYPDHFDRDSIGETHKIMDVPHHIKKYWQILLAVGVGLIAAIILKKNGILG